MLHMLEEKYPERPCSVSNEMSPMGRVGATRGWHLHKLLFEQMRLKEA